MKNLLFTLLFISASVFTFGTNNNNPVSKDKSAEASAASTISTVSLTGKVIDLNSGETLAGVEVTIEGSTKKTHTDLDGNFRFDGMQPGAYNVIASYISYKKSFIEKLEVGKPDQSLNIKLQSAN